MESDLYSMSFAIAVVDVLKCNVHTTQWLCEENLVVLDCTEALLKYREFSQATTSRTCLLYGYTLRRSGDTNSAFNLNRPVLQSIFPNITSSTYKSPARTILPCIQGFKTNDGAFVTPLQSDLHSLLLPMQIRSPAYSRKSEYCYTDIICRCYFCFSNHCINSSLSTILQE